MSSDSVQVGDPSKPSSSGSEDELDLFALMGDRSEREAKTALWYGIAMGMILVLGAAWASMRVSDVWSIDELSPTWHDWVWVVVAFMGIPASFAISAHLSRVRKKGDLPYDAMAAFGGAVSVAVILILVFDSYERVRTILSLGEGVMWPYAKPLWFLPLSAIGVAVPIVALIQVRRGDARDRAIGSILPCASVAILSLPFLLGFGPEDVTRWMPTVYAAAGILLMFSGLRPFLYMSEVTLDSLEYLSMRVFMGVLVFTGIVGWMTVSTGEHLSSSEDLVWFLPLASSLVVSLMLVAAVSKVPRGRRPFAPEALGYSGLVWSLVLLSMYVMGSMDLFGLDRVRIMAMYPLSMFGITLVMVGVNLFGPRTETDRNVGIVFAVLPTAVTGLVALVAHGSQEVAHAALSGGAALWAYVGLALLVLVSGMKVETFRKSQWPVLREKQMLTRKRTFHLTRQVLRNPMGLIGVVILVIFAVIAVIGPYIAPYEVDMTVNGDFPLLEKPSPEHWMGTDSFGHDIFSELLYGARTSMVVGIVAAIISSVLGAAIGLYSGYAGGWRDETIMRLNDIVLSLPWLVLMIIIAAFMGSITLVGIILVIGLTGWSGTARLVRAQVLSLRERQYVERAKAIGSDDLHIIRTHVLPNAFPLVFANTILTVAISILSEATLSFLGLRPQGTVTWGTMLSYAQSANAFALGMHWWIIAPGVCIVFVVLGFTLMGYAFDDVMNPKLRKR